VICCQKHGRWGLAEEIRWDHLRDGCHVAILLPKERIHLAFTSQFTTHGFLSSVVVAQASEALGLSICVFLDSLGVPPSHASSPKPWWKPQQSPRIRMSGSQKKKQNVGTKKYKEMLTVSHQPSTITLGMISPCL